MTIIIQRILWVVAGLWLADIGVVGIVWGFLAACALIGIVALLCYGYQRYVPERPVGRVEVRMFGEKLYRMEVA